VPARVATSGWRPALVPLPLLRAGPRRALPAGGIRVAGRNWRVVRQGWFSTCRVVHRHRLRCPVRRLPGRPPGTRAAPAARPRRVLR